MKFNYININQRIQLGAFRVHLCAIVLLGVFSSCFADEPGELLTGQKQVFVVHGYSTSFNWPDVLQRKFDRHFGEDGVVEVVKATKGSTPIAKWMDVESGEPSEHWENILRPVIESAKGKPVHILAQQSLQWVWDARAVGIEDENDKKRIREGAEVLDLYTNKLLHEKGVESVFVATHIYKNGMEPVIGNERLALAEFFKSKPNFIYAGPDVWEPTREMWPEAFQADKVHPNEMGAEIMAHYWFAVLFKHDGRKVPEWSAEEMEAAKNGKLPTTTTSTGGSGGGGMKDGRGGMKGGKGGGGRKMKLSMITGRHDKNGDNVVTQEEFTGPPRFFQRLDANGDGKVSADDFAESNDGASRGAGGRMQKKSMDSPKSAPTTTSSVGSDLEKLIAGLSDAHVADKMLDKYGHKGAPVGSMVKDVEVYRPDGVKVPLSTLWKEKPALIVTASMSCGPSCRGLPDMGSIAEHFGDEVEVAILYIVEAHPSEGSSPYNGGRSGGKKKTSNSQKTGSNGIVQPKDIEQRLDNAQGLIERNKPQVPIIVDNMKNSAWKTVGQGPNIAVLLDASGKIVVRQGWFNAKEMAGEIATLLKSK